MRLASLLATGAALALPLAACSPPHPHARIPRTISALDCPQSEGDLTRKSQAGDGKSCLYASDSGEVSLRLLALDGANAGAVLDPIEASLRSEIAGAPPPLRRSLREYGCDLGGDQGGHRPRRYRSARHSHSCPRRRQGQGQRQSRRRRHRRQRQRTEPRHRRRRREWQGRGQRRSQRQWRRRPCHRIGRRNPPRRHAHLRYARTERLPRGGLRGAGACSAARSSWRCSSHAPTIGRVSRTTCANSSATTSADKIVGSGAASLG